jgi:microcystin-dependent protein
MFKKFQLIAQIVGCLTLAFLAIFGLLTLLRADPARALGLEPAAAQAPQARPNNAPETLNYQGTLRDSAGVLLTGAYTMTFRLYANVSDPVATTLWSEEQTGVVVREGVFDVVLGDITPLPATLFSASDHRYLGITVDPYQEMIPRQALSSVPYAMQAEMPDELPPGSIMAYAGTTAPPGWLLCDGSAVSRMDYPYLFEAIGITHGYGDQSTTFNIPDFRGRFLRGVDAGAGRDPDAGSRPAMNAGGNTGDSVGSVQADEFRAHSHTYARFYGAYSVNEPGNTDYFWNGVYYDITGNAGGSETRPVNAYVYWIIKY